MNFISVRIITADIARLVPFDEKVTGMTADKPLPVFAEFRTAVGTLAIGATETLAPFGGDHVAQASANRSPSSSSRSTTWTPRSRVAAA